MSKLPNYFDLSTLFQIVIFGLFMGFLGYAVGYISVSRDKTCVDPKMYRKDIRYFFDERGNRTQRFSTVVDCNDGHIVVLDTEKTLNEVFEKW